MTALKSFRPTFLPMISLGDLLTCAFVLSLATPLAFKLALGA